MEAVRQVILKIADDLMALSALVLEDDRVGINQKIGRNTLKNSVLKGDLAVRISETYGQDPVINALFNHYVVYLEWNRPKKYGKKPPISVLKGWASKNGIPTDARTLWAISTAIWRDGHVGRPIFATIDKELDGLFYKDWSDKLFNATIENLETFF